MQGLRQRRNVLRFCQFYFHTPIIGKHRLKPEDLSCRCGTPSSGPRATLPTTETHGTSPSKTPWNRRVPNSASGLKNGTLCDSAADPSHTSKAVSDTSSSVLSRRDLSLGKWPPDLYTEPRRPGMLLARRLRAARDLHSVLLKKGDGDRGDASGGFRGFRAAGVQGGADLCRKCWRHRLE